MNLLNPNFLLMSILYMKIIWHITKNRSKKRFLDKNENNNILTYNIVAGSAFNNVKDNLDKETKICLVLDNIFYL